MSRQRRCRICHKRPPWRGKNCPPGVCKRCYHREIWADRPAARTARQAESALQVELEDDDVIETLTAASGDLSADTPEDDPEARLPPWPVRRVTAGMKRCAIPEAEEIDILFSDFLMDEPDPWAEADLDVKTAIQEDHPADLMINVAVEELVRQRFELPAFSILDAPATHVRAVVHRRLFGTVLG